MGRGVPTIAVILLIWLAIGFTFAYNRGYVRTAGKTCSAGASAVKTTIYGPLNFISGVNPAVRCTVKTS
jgi:hypothetical protein